MTIPCESDCIRRKTDGRCSLESVFIRFEVCHRQAVCPNYYSNRSWSEPYADDIECDALVERNGRIEKCGRTIPRWSEHLSSPDPEHAIGNMWFCQLHYGKIYEHVVRYMQIDAERAIEDNRRYSILRSRVYFVQRNDGFIKIGVSENPRSRRVSLEREHGPLKQLALVHGDYGYERLFHCRFEEYRIPDTREWFEPSEDILHCIERINALELHKEQDDNMIIEKVDTFMTGIDNEYMKILEAEDNGGNNDAG